MYRYGFEFILAPDEVFEAARNFFYGGYLIRATPET